MEADEAQKKHIGRPKGVKDSYPRPSRKDLSFQGNQETTKGDMSRYIRQIRFFSDLPKIDYKDIDQLKERIALYWEVCEQNGTKPCVSGLCNAIGVSRKTFYAWAAGDRRAGSEWQDIAISAYNQLEELLEMQMQDGKLNPVTGIFLAKNHFGYADKQEVVLSPNTKLGDEPDQKALEEKYLESIVCDEFE